MRPQPASNRAPKIGIDKIRLRRPVSVAGKFCKRLNSPKEREFLLHLGRQRTVLPTSAIGANWPLSADSAKDRSPTRKRCTARLGSAERVDELVRTSNFRRQTPVA